MIPTSHKSITAVSRISISLLAVAGFAAAQDQTPHGWRSVNEPPPAGAVDDRASQAGQPPNYNAQQAPYNGAPADQRDYPAQNNYPPQNNYPAQNNYPPPNTNYGIPARLTIKPGTYVTVRLNQWLSSDHNQQGDTFTATLQQPVVVDGIVVAQRGQTVYGRVTEAQKAGRVEGTSRLGVELTGLSLVDGQQVAIQSEMINRNGTTSTGRDAAAIGGTTALGAIIGAGAGYGQGAAIGAGAGAAAGIIGVLLTRGRPTVIYPESVLTFQMEAPVSIDTDRAPQAFRYVESRDYARTPAISSNRPPAAPAPPPPPYGPGYYPPYAYGGYPYPAYGGVAVFVGPRYGHFYGPGIYGGYRRFRR